MTTSEAAQQLGITERHVRRLIRDGKIAAQRDGRGWQIVETPKHKKRGIKERALREARRGITPCTLIAREMAQWAERFFGGRSEIYWIGPVPGGKWRVRNDSVPKEKWVELYQMAYRFVAEAGRRLHDPEG